MTSTIQRSIPKSTIYNALVAAKWSRKVVKQRALQQSAELREAWEERRKGWYIEQIVCLDESGYNPRVGDRKYGWSLQGGRTVDSAPLVRSKRWSILPACAVEEWITHTMFQGGGTAEIFLEFLEHQVLPLMAPYPARRSILVLDNASIHHSKQVQTLCDQAGVILAYLPPYSPDFNPIEQTFGTLKAWIKRHHQDIDGFDDFGAFLEYAVQSHCYSPMDAQFAYPGYRDPDIII